MDFRKIICFTALTLTCFVSRAQFYLYGDDPGWVRWSQIKTENYRLVYPRGLDSLAGEYALSLEQYRTAVGASAGFLPNESYRKRMPVILHAFSQSANGVVAWTPRRMEFYTTQSAYDPSALPWITELSVHESRHTAQMQYSNTQGYKVFNVLIGQLWGGAMAAVYGNQAFFEGDAVVAETALTHSGRGRTADFLEYYRVAFDNGDYRDWYKWNYGSIKKYAPTYYTLGYMTVGGIRALYDDPLFTDRFYHNIFRHKLWPFPMFNMQHTVKEASGKSFRKTFPEIEHYFREQWSREAAQRAPFIESEPYTDTPRRFRQYTGTVLAGSCLLSVQSGLDVEPGLVDLDRGTRLRAFSASASRLQWSGTLGKVFWSENIRNARWSLGGSSRIRYLIPGTGRTGDLTKKGRLFNPAPNPSDARIAVTSYPYQGGSDVLVLNGWTGEEIQSFHAPDSIQVVETSWIGDDIAVSGISDGGFGLYNASDGFRTVLKPQPVKIKQLRSGNDGSLMFISDRNGVDELYSLDPESGRLEQMTSTRYGISDFAVRGDSLYYSMLSTDARGVYRTALSDLTCKEADQNDIFSYKVADILSAQEAELGSFSSSQEICVPEAENYVKAMHLVKIHSWAPLYFDYSNISSLSMDIFSKSVKPGAMAFFQNDLGTSSGYIAYAISQKGQGGLRHEGHVNFTYSGLLPVIEAYAHLNSGSSSNYNSKLLDIGRTKQLHMTKSYSERIPLSGGVTIYVPLSFYRGGRNSGIIPQLRYTASNNVIYTGTPVFGKVPSFKPGSTVFNFQRLEEGDFRYMQWLTASVRAYTMLSKHKSGTYPRLGVGAEVGVDGRIGLSGIFSPNAFVYGYGYLPGIVPEHGMRLTALVQKHLNDRSMFMENSVKCLPRGYSEVPDQSSTFTDAEIQAKFTLDYSMSILPVDWSFLCPLFYIRNFILTPHIDYSIFKSDEGNLGLCSVGADFSTALGNLLWLPFDSEFGVSYSYNCGHSFKDLDKATVVNRYFIGLIFNVSLQ